MISVLCVHKRSNYKLIENLDLWDEERNAYNFTGTNPVIAHPPCAQWSRMKAFAYPDLKEKMLAAHCYDLVMENGGIFEHPAGSSLWKYVGANRKQIISIDQHWFGFPARKTTYLLFSKCEPLSYPLSFSTVQRKVCSMHSQDRAIMPFAFCFWLVDNITQTFKPINYDQKISI